MSSAFVIHGLTASFFTRKVTGYLDYKGLRWRLSPSVGLNLDARAAGWNGGIPVLVTPQGEMIWDSTAIILHLETRHPEPSVVPSDPTLAFLGHVIEDFSDEWLYRPAVGTRWLYPENTLCGSWDLAREAAFEVPVATTDEARTLVSDAMIACLPRLGVTAQNIDAWVQESVLPWQRTLAAHVEANGYLLGKRPSLADFALFGGNVAHFVNDPLCRRWMDESASAVVAYTHRMAFRGAEPGEWLDAGDVPDSLLALLAQIGRHYLPWVVAATRSGTGAVRFDEGGEARMETTSFLNGARGVLLARYVRARSPQLDALLERAGILRYFAEHTDQATTIPDPTAPPRPADNQPFRAG